MAWTQAYDIINALRRKLGLEHEFFAITKVWAKEVGIDGIDITGYKNGTIFAKTQSSVAVYELNLRKKEIIIRLNQYVGQTLIKDIKVKIV
jgi:hypothetical protein